MSKATRSNSNTVIGDEITAIFTETCTILNGASMSDILDLRGVSAVRFIMPAAWTAAALTFQVSVDGTNFFDLYDNLGIEKNIPVVASRAINLDVSELAFIDYLKIRSGTSGTPVNQGADRVISVIVVVL